ncbi:MurR/RpiR family transcriptional regulator [Sporolactobacillus sp. Y61]|uniref:MurR/RpiR family transcriptional regulator n=1 Tax=Sporolactobacillus sp. Y61 TaxID=3160863 RepID=A0AAU8IJ09_9BACL
MDTSVILQIQERMNDLSRSEKKIGAYVLEHPADAVNHSTNELAQMIGVSPATIVRFCRSIGLSGFSQLKVRLYAESMGVMDQSLYTDIEPEEQTGEIAEKLAFRFQQSIAQTKELMDSPSMNSFSDLIDQKRVIYVYGLGASRVVAEDLAHKFSRIGKAVMSYSDHHLLASALINADPDCMLVAISNSGETDEVIKMVRIARQNGLYTVGISHNGTNQLSEQVDLSIRHGGGEPVLLRSAATTSLIAQLFTVDVLYYVYVCRHYESALKKIGASRIIIQKMFSGNGE